jgi:hypothetical protein
MAFTGGCLCGRVRYQSDREPVAAGHCHCVDCRKSSGTGHCSHLAVPEAGFRITGNLTFYASPSDSGHAVSRGFCPACGAPLYSTNEAMPGMVFVRASSLDDPEVFRPQVVVYTSRAPSWDPPATGLASFPEMPPQPPV